MSQRDSARNAIIGILCMLYRDSHQSGQMDGMGLSREAAEALGLRNDPDERLREYLDPVKQREMHDELLEAMKDHPHHPGCSGRCGALWFFGELADALLNLGLSDAERVSLALREMGVPEGDADGHAQA